MRMQIGPREGQIIELEIPKLSLHNLGIEKLDISTAEGASVGIGRLDGAVAYLTQVRSRLGAYQNRMESTATSLEITHENLTSAYSRIMDVDMAEEMTRYTTYQVLTQSGTSMLAQANESPSSVLQLLQ
jgi:flagellin